MAIDYITAIELRIMALLEGSGEMNFFCQQIKPGNRFTKITGLRWPLPPDNLNSRNVNSFTIDGPDVRSVNRNQMKTFSNSNSAVGDVVVIQEYAFNFVIRWLSLDRRAPNGLKMFMDGILLADPTLGISSPPVRGSGEMTGTSKEENSDSTGGTLRLVQRLRFPVTVELHRADLIAAAAYAG